MRLRSPWNPRLADATSSSPCDRLATALSEDILDGSLETGDRLPAHRDLADQLGIGIGTVTKAYGMLERRGLVRSVKGRGTFVAISHARRGPLIDLSRNAPPAAMTERVLARTLSAVAKRADAGHFNHYPPFGGHDEHRRMMAQWFAKVGLAADPSVLMLTSGAHHAVAVAVSVACGHNGTLFTESETYPGAIALARFQGVPLRGVAIDDEGLIPDALDRALANCKTERAAVYVTPTMQNPTAATMSLARRQDIVSVCRARSATIIEDDVYALRADESLPPLAMLAPERTFYANSMSKTVNPSMRIGGLVVPRSSIDAALNTLQATAVMVSPLTCALMEQWILDGTADALSLSIQTEAERRTIIAEAILGGLMKKRERRGYHVWLPMTKQKAAHIELAARSIGVLLTPPSSTAATDDNDGGLRLCLGAPSLPDLTCALESMAKLLAQASAPTAISSSLF